MKKRGSVFILFLWVLILLSVFAVSIGFRTRLAAKIEGFETNDFELGYDFLSAVNLARFFIDSDLEPAVDYSGDAWYGAPAEFTKMEIAQRFDLEIRDEESKIDLNRATAPFLDRFFRVLAAHGIKLESDPKDLAGAILAWRGQVAGIGGSTLGFEHKKAPFESADELELVQRMTPRDARLLKPFVTAFAGPAGLVMRVNLNTVHPYILEALVFHLPGGDFTKQELFRKIDEFRTGKSKNILASGQKQVFQAEDLRAETMIQKLNLDNSFAMNQLVNLMLPFLTVDSQYYSVAVRSKLPRKELFAAQAVLGPRMFRPTSIQDAAKTGGLTRSGQMGRPVTTPLEILEWHEGIFAPVSGEKTGGA